MTTNIDYNGWKGNGTRESAYSTWNMALWVDNEYSIYQAKEDMISKHKGLLSATAVKCFCEMFFPEGTPDLQGEYGSIDLINWQEIADNWNYDKVNG